MLHAVTAEPGGEKVLRERLMHHMNSELKGIQIRSDPFWSMMNLAPKEKPFIPVIIPTPETSGPVPNVQKTWPAYCEPYKMVQPAVVIADSTREALNWWSWKFREGQCCAPCSGAPRHARRALPPGRCQHPGEDQDRHLQRGDGA